jgi:hypothetical protein
MWILKGWHVLPKRRHRRLTEGDGVGFQTEAKASGLQPAERAPTARILGGSVRGREETHYTRWSAPVVSDSVDFLVVSDSVDFCAPVVSDSVDFFFGAGSSSMYEVYF